MLILRRMTKNDVPTLYNMALRSFQADYNRCGYYPPFMKDKTKSFLPPLMLGKVVLVDNEIVGGAFVLGIGKKGEIGSIFIDPIHQKKGYGRQLMLEIEKSYPRVKKWKLDVLAENYHLHRFYESLGYKRIGRVKNKTYFRPT